MAIEITKFTMRFPSKEERRRVMGELHDEFKELNFVERNEDGPAYFLDFDATQLHIRLIKTKWGG